MKTVPDYEHYDYTAILELFQNTKYNNDSYSEIKLEDYSLHKYKTRSLPKRLGAYLEMLGRNGRMSLGFCSVVEYLLKKELDTFNRTIHRNGDVIFYPAQYNELTKGDNYMSQGVELHMEYLKGKLSSVQLVARYEEKK